MKLLCLSEKVLNYLQNISFERNISNHHHFQTLWYLHKNFDWKYCSFEELESNAENIEKFFIKKFKIIPEYIIFFYNSKQIYEWKFPSATKILNLVVDTIHGKSIYKYKTICYNKCDAAFINYAYNVQKMQPDVKSEKLIFLPHSCYYKSIFNPNPDNKIFVGGHIKNYPPREHLVKLSKSTFSNKIIHYAPPVGYNVSVEKQQNILFGQSFTDKMNEYIACFTCDVIGGDKKLIEECGGNGYIVAKHFEILSSGSLLVAFNERTKDMFSLLGFNDGEHYISVTYDNLEDKLNYILDLKNRKEIDNIRKTGYEYCLKYHNYKERAKYIQQWTEDKSKLDLSIHYNKRYDTSFVLGFNKNL